MKKSMFILIVFFCFVSAQALGMEVYKNENLALKSGFWGQVWYQTISDGRDTNGDGRQDSGIYDTLIRRAYFYARADIFRKIVVFAHLAGDRIGQDYMKRRPSLGLGANLVLRDGWIALDPWGGIFKIQVGRMYVPLTRNYGTTSTKTLLNLDLNWSQGGLRGGIFYPSKVGRDDGICLWGNILEKRLQYRLMVGRGIYDDDVNPDDHPRFAGRLSWAFMEPETGWFNQGTYLGKKHILTIGIGADFQGDLHIISPQRKQDYSAYTFDIHWDRPLNTGLGAVTVEAAFVHVNNEPNRLAFTHLTKASDVSIYSLKGGYLLPWEPHLGKIQPNFHYERIDPEDGGATNIFGGGINYFLKGHANKLSFDLTSVDQTDATPGAVQDHLLFTMQLALGF